MQLHLTEIHLQKYPKIKILLPKHKGISEGDLFADILILTREREI